MGKISKIGYSLKDIAVVQAQMSFQLHRSEVFPFNKTCGRDTYPIFVSPMAAVTDEKNYKTWIKNKVTPVVPRSVQGRLSIDERLNIAKETFVSFSLSEVELLFNEDKFKKMSDDDVFYICIDIAHGTLSSLYNICRNIKEKYGDGVIIMTGNIANPSAYIEYCRAGIDYVRCSVGTGSRCTSSCAVSIHYPMATLLDEINSLRNRMNTEMLCEINKTFKITKVIADGGIGWYDDIQKALVLGADYVMIGKLFAECEEACGEIGWATSMESFAKGDYLDDKGMKRLIKDYDNYGGLFIPNAEHHPSEFKRYRMYSGMSHRSMQKITGGNGEKVSEGICKPVEVKYSVKHWITNMDSYLRSCMTYTDSRTLDDLKTSEVIILGGSGDSVYRK
jgi:IMP dehydrogenase/GMP reductase